jgi:hypothetical protein
VDRAINELRAARPALRAAGNWIALADSTRDLARLEARRGRLRAAIEACDEVLPTLSTRTAMRCLPRADPPGAGRDPRAVRRPQCSHGSRTSDRARTAWRRRRRFVSRAHSAIASLGCPLARCLLGHSSSRSRRARWRCCGSSRPGGQSPDRRGAVRHRQHRQDPRPHRVRKARRSEPRRGGGAGRGLGLLT